jgi:predicted MFS family arabinose efflux permease
MANSLTQKIWSRDFFLIFLSNIVFSSALCLLIPTLPIYLLKGGSTEVQIGVLIGTSGIASLIVRPFIGRALVKVTEKSFMMVGGVLFAIGSVGYIFASSFWFLLMVRIIQGVGSALFYTAAVTRVANTSPNSRLGESLAYYYLAFNIAFALVPSFGTFLINDCSFTVLFLVCTSLTLGYLLIVARLRRRSVNPSKQRDAKKGPLVNREALPTAVVAMISSMHWGALTAFFPLYALTHGVSNPGLFFSAFAVMIISGRGLGGRLLDLHSRERVILPCLTTVIIAMIILVFSKTLPMFIVAGLVWGIGHAFVFPALAASVLERTASSPGPAMATFSALDELGTGLGSVVAGIILRLSGYPMMFFSLAFIGILNIVYFYFFVGKRRRGDL